MELKLDAEAAASIASAAIFESLSTAARDDLIQQSIKHLLTPEKSTSYGSVPNQSPLQKAFDQAITTVAYQVVRDEILKDEAIQAEVKRLVGPLVLGAVNAQSADYTDDTLAYKIGEVLGSWLAEQARAR